MNWSFFDEFITFFSELNDFATFLGDSFSELPGIFKFVLSFIAVIVLVSGTLKYCFKLIG